MRIALICSEWCWRPPASEVSSRALRFTVLQPVQVDLQPALLGKFIGWIQQIASRVPERLAGMIEIDDLNGAGKVPIRNILDPMRGIGHHHADGSEVRAPMPSSMASNISPSTSDRMCECPGPSGIYRTTPRCVEGVLRDGTASPTATARGSPPETAPSPPAASGI